MALNMAKLLLTVIITAILLLGTDVNTSITGSNGMGEGRTTTQVLERLTYAMTTIPSEQINLYNPTLELMEYYMKTQKHAIDFISSFKNGLQRDIVETQLKICPFVTLCNFTVGAQADRSGCCGPCLCKNCESDKTCCPDIITESEFIIPILNSSMQFDAGNNSKVEDNNLLPVCEMQHLTVRPSKGFLAIADCPRESDPLLSYNCSRPYTKQLGFSAVLPVFNNRSLEVFRNKFCALCNGNNEEDLVYFKPLFSCKDNTNMLRHFSSEMDIIDLVFSTEDCDIKFICQDTRINVLECMYHISRCNVTGSWTMNDVHLVTACKSYMSLYRHKGLEFRNVFCAMCNGIDPQTVFCDDDSNLNTDVFPFSGLLKLDFTQGFSTSYLEQGETLDESSCTETQALDKLTNTCKDLYCSELRTLRNENCVAIFENMMNDFKFILYLRIKPVTPLTLTNAIGNQSYFLNDLQNLLITKYPKMSLCDAQIAFKVNKHYTKSDQVNLQESEVLYADARVRLGERSGQPWEVSDNLLKLHGSDFEVFYDGNETREFVVYLMHKDDRPFNIIEQLGTKSYLNYHIPSRTDINEQINTLSRYAMIDIDGFTLLPFSVQYQQFDICRLDTAEINSILYSACPKVNISKFDIYWTETIDGLQIDDLKIQSDKYYFIDHYHIMICVDTFREIVKHLEPKRSLNSEMVVSIASSLLSIISLLVTLVVFSMFSKLRSNLPGKNNMSLVASLMVAQVMFFVGSLGTFQQFSLSCKVVGLVIHFSWLHAIFWMNVCTYHMFYIFSQTRKMSADHGWKRFALYHMYVCMMSLLFVLANVMSSFFMTGNIGYGGKFCYIISRENILYTFGLPTFSVVFANLFMFLFIIIKIKGQPSIQKNVQNERNNIIIFAKLSTITGIAWLFGFLQSWTDIQTFSYIFIVLNAGQGVFILLAFVVNRQVLLLFQELKLNSQKHYLMRSKHKTPGSSGSTVSSKF